MIYSIKDGKYSGDNTLSTAWGAAFIAGAAERGYNIGQEPVAFRDHDNGDHSLTIDNLRTLLREAQVRARTQ